MQELAGVFDNGLAIGLIVAGAMFLYFKFWPWYVKRQETRDAEENRRHREYLDSFERNNRITENFTDAVKAVNMTMQSTAQLISAQTDRMDDYHEEIMRELRS